MGSFVYNVPGGFGFVADLSGGKASNVSGTPQSISLVNYLFGPRYSLRLGSSRFTPYGQVLLGGSLEQSNYTSAQKVAGFAFMPGGGVKVRLSRHVGYMIEADWMHSYILNNTNNRQNDLRIDTGITFRFAPH